MSAKRRKTTANQGMLPDPKIVVGIDFGTTFSGFAYAAKADPGKVFKNYLWPSQKEAHASMYCKTQTSLWYMPGKSNGTFDLQDWGWPAQVKYRNEASKAEDNMKVMSRSSSSLEKQAFPISNCGHFLTKFKLYLDAAGSNSDPRSNGEKLPEGLLAERLISDYLKQLSVFIMAELRNRYGSVIHGCIEKKDIQWCLTVPTIWTDAAKRTMKDCAEMAGLVRGPLCPRDEDASPHAMVMVLEPEAASVYCLQKDTHLRKGSKFLVVDAGGGTVDLVVHEKVDDSSLRVKEVTCSTGDRCGGTFVDTAFMRYLSRKIDCFMKFSTRCPATVLAMKKKWEDCRCSFDGQLSYILEVPPKLAEAWETHQKENGFNSMNSQFDEIVITTKEMKGIFDQVVCKILRLINDQLQQVPEIETIMVVGGFSNSPYLMKKIRDSFSRLVKRIVCPPDPESAVCQGAVVFGLLGKDIMMSRKSRKTYGIALLRQFQKGDPPGSMILDDCGEALCTDAFFVFTRRGDDVPVNHYVTHSCVPVKTTARTIRFTIYSTSDLQPAFVTDPGMVKVGTWSFLLPPEARKIKSKKLELEVTMYFGRTHIEVSAKHKDFGVGMKSMVSIVFEREYSEL